MHEKDYTFPVMEGHRSLSRKYCELCGGEVDRNGENLHGCDDNRGSDITMALDVLRWACRLHTHRPKSAKQILTVLGLKMDHPEYSMRDMEKYTGVRKSRVGDIMREVVELMPGTSALLGLETPKARSQKQRRSKEQKENNT